MLLSAPSLPGKTVAVVDGEVLDPYLKDVPTVPAGGAMVRRSRHALIPFGADGVQPLCVVEDVEGKRPKTRPPRRSARGM